MLPSAVLIKLLNSPFFRISWSGVVQFFMSYQRLSGCQMGGGGEKRVTGWVVVVVDTINNVIITTAQGWKKL